MLVRGRFSGAEGGLGGGRGRLGWCLGRIEGVWVTGRLLCRVCSIWMVEMLLAMSVFFGLVGQMDTCSVGGI